MPTLLDLPRDVLAAVAAFLTAEAWQEEMPDDVGDAAGAAPDDFSPMPPASYAMLLAGLPVKRAKLGRARRGFTGYGACARWWREASRLRLDALEEIELICDADDTDFCDAAPRLTALAPALRRVRARRGAGAFPSSLAFLPSGLDELELVNTYPEGTAGNEAALGDAAGAAVSRFPRDLKSLVLADLAVAPTNLPPALESLRVHSCTLRDAPAFAGPLSARLKSLCIEYSDVERIELVSPSRLRCLTLNRCALFDDAGARPLLAAATALEELTLRQTRVTVRAPLPPKLRRLTVVAFHEPLLDFPQGAADVPLSLERLTVSSVADEALVCDLLERGVTVRLVSPLRTTAGGVRVTLGRSTASGRRGRFLKYG